MKLLLQKIGMFRIPDAERIEYETQFRDTSDEFSIKTHMNKISITDILNRNLQFPWQTQPTTWILKDIHLIYLFRLT